jgi:hypothetical protein
MIFTRFLAGKEIQREFRPVNIRQEGEIQREFLPVHTSGRWGKCRDNSYSEGARKERYWDNSC